MGHQAKATAVLQNALKRTNATIKKKDGRAKHDVFKAWTVAKLLETYRDPRAILLEIASMDTKALAAEMKGTLADALAERRLCAQAVLPYVAQKLPVQVDMRHTRAIHLNIVDERQYQDLVEVAATEASDDESFSLQLMPSNADEVGGDGQVQGRGDMPVTSAAAAPADGGK
jgi:hypothetical protein